MPYRVLIADDDKVNVQLLSDICRSAEMTVQVAKDGEETLQMALAEPPDIILLDVMMPRRDGFQVVQELRRDPYTRGIPIILVTAVSDSDAIRKGYQLGANDYIIKPFRVGELLSRLRAHLLAAAYQRLPQGAEVWSLGDQKGLVEELGAQLARGRQTGSLLVAELRLTERNDPCPPDDAVMARATVAMAHRLRLEVRGTDRVFLLPGNRVAFLLEGTGREGVQSVARRLTSRAAEPLELGGRQVTLRTRWAEGVSMEGEPSPEGVIQRACRQLD